MKMKKLVMTAIFAALAMGAAAQSINVSSAHEALKRGYLDKAKKYIDAACEHETTKNDANTWRYRALIYAQIGSDNQSKKPKYKNLAADWVEQAYNSAIECKRLDTDHSYASEISEVFTFVGHEYNRQARAAYEAKNYAGAIEVAEKAATCHNNAGVKSKQYAQDALYIAGISSVATRDTANIKKYFNSMVKGRTDINYVYLTLFTIYMSEKNTAQAMKVVNNYVKFCPRDYKAYLLRATGYLLDNNVEKGKEDINSALTMTRDSVNVYPDVLVQAGELLSDYAHDYDAAEAKFTESQTLRPDQFGASFGMGKMLYNRAVDKNKAANAIDPFDPDEEKIALYEKLSQEAKGYFGQSIVYLEKAVNYIDGLTDPNAKNAQLNNLINVLEALSTAYAQVNRNAESQAAKNRVKQLAAQ